MACDLSTARFLDVEAEVRYWEDARVNGVEDEDGTIFGRDGAVWRIRIDLETGAIVDWPSDTRADIHYKVCDQGEYWLVSADGVRLAKWRDYYVPSAFLCHGDCGWGDYIIFRVADNGRIDGYSRPQIDDDDWCRLSTPEGER